MVVVTSTEVVVDATSVVVVWGVVVVDGSVVVDSTVVDVAATEASAVHRSYCTPCHHWSGFPQHTPARSRYEPACNGTSNRDWSPYQSSFCASKTPSAVNNQSIGSDQNPSTENVRALKTRCSV